MADDLEQRLAGLEDMETAAQVEILSEIVAELEELLRR